MINDKEYIFEPSITGDFALIKGWKADTKGNIVFRKTARNLNPECAKAAKITIAEVEEIVPAGSLDPDHIHLPGIFVHRLIKGEKYEKAIEKITTNGKSSSSEKKSETQLKREKIAKRAAKEVRDGMYVNLGIGIPTLVSNFVEDGIDVQLHAENGMLGTGEYPDAKHVDPDLINASKETISEKPGCSYFSSSESFSIVRGSHISLTILGGMQVDQNGDLANWIIPNKLVRGMGGAMDLVSSNSKVITCMEHASKKGESKILKKCKLPITGKGCVWKIVTDLAVFEFVQGKGLVLQEIFEDTTLDEVKSLTEAEFTVDANLKTIKI
jgi:3-oxoacid CoA-transferase